MPDPTLRQQAARLPIHPGVYLFKDTVGTVLYVGKATVLRERVRSYFAKEIGRGPGIEKMVRLAQSLAYYETDSEAEALLLEAKLIRQHKPPYNIRLRDDKSFSLIRIDLSEDFPGIYLAREKDLEELLSKRRRDRSTTVKQRIDQQDFYGPYLSSRSAKAALRTIRKIWPFRDCSSQKYRHYAQLGHGCLFASLGVCTAPCILAGRVAPSAPLKGLPAQAAEDAPADLLTAYREFQREYRENIDQLRAFLRGEHSKVLNQVQDEMVRAAESEQYERAALLRDRLQALTHVQQMAHITRHTERSAMRDKDLAGMEATAYNPAEDIQIEAYDISNNQGAHAVGSVVSGIIRQGKVLALKGRVQARERFRFDKDRYRKFRIKSVTGVSDVEMLEEVLRRRCKRSESQDERWRLPDFIVVDGGPAQLGVARKVTSDYELVVGSVAKGPTRKRVDLYGNGWADFPQVDHEAWLLIAELLREEAHRFVINYYRLRHRKGMVGER